MSEIIKKTENIYELLLILPMMYDKVNYNRMHRQERSKDECTIIR